MGVMTSRTRFHCTAINTLQEDRRMSSLQTKTSLVILVTLAILAAAAGPADAGKKFLYVKSATANIRSLPSIHGEVLESAPFGSRMLRVEHSGDWYLVALADGTRGFIYDELVTDDHPERLWVETGMANVRQDPNAWAPILGTLPAGSELRSLGKGDDWYKVELDDGTSGWIHEDVVDLDPPGILFVDVISARVLGSCSLYSDTIAEVRAGDELHKVVKYGDFYQVRLDDGAVGFIHEDSVSSDLPRIVVVDVPAANLKTDPTMFGTVKATVAAGTELRAFDDEDDFYLVETPDGTLGWIYDDNVIRTGS
jgi:uncharacterized protein YgiM (DUF1202 family)